MENQGLPESGNKYCICLSLRSRTHKCNKMPSFCVLASYYGHKMQLNLKEISVQDLWQIKHFSDITLVDEDTNKYGLNQQKCPFFSQTN